MLWGQMSIWGHLGSLGSKGRFHLKCYNSFILHSMTIRLIHVYQLETRYLFYGVKCQFGVNWGHRGQKVIFTKNALIHIIQHDHKTHTCSSAWDPLPMIWVKYKSGVIWGHRGQKVIFSKNATFATEYMVLSALCNIVYPCYHVTHKYALTWDSQLHSLVQGQLGITSADRVRRLWRQHVSSYYCYLYHSPGGGGVS